MKDPTVGSFVYQKKEAACVGHIVRSLQGEGHSYCLSDCIVGNVALDMEEEYQYVE